MLSLCSKVVTSLPLDHPLGQPEELIRNVIEKRILPSYSLYYLPTSAAWWAQFSKDETMMRSPLEAAAWKYLGIRKCLLQPAKDCHILSIIGLGVGEGHGELALLKEILSDFDETVQVHYLAVDLSPSLLLNHALNLSLEFRHYIATGRLVCATVLGDIFDLSQAHLPEWDPIRRAREIVSANFLPWFSPMIVTYLGNCMGNGDPNSEQMFFELIRTRLGENARAIHQHPAGPLQCLVGVSVDREEPDIYTRNWDNFLLQGVRRLVECNLLHVDNGTMTSMFTTSPIDANRSVRPVEYITSFGLRGHRYVFDHELENRISALLPSGRFHSPMRRFLDKGSTIQLYAITKYNMDTMLTYLDDFGFTIAEAEGLPDNFLTKHYVENKTKWLAQTVSTENGDRSYGIFCVSL